VDQSGSYRIDRITFEGPKQNKKIVVGPKWKYKKNKINDQICNLA
jgi:hypothetical protein